MPGTLSHLLEIRSSRMQRQSQFHLSYRFRGGHFRQAVFTFAQIFYIPLYLHRGVSSIIEKKLTAALSHACRSNFNHSDHLFFSLAKLPSRHLHRLYDSPPVTEPRREYDFP